MQPATAGAKRFDGPGFWKLIPNEAFCVVELPDMNWTLLLRDPATSPSNARRMAAVRNVPKTEICSQVKRLILGSGQWLQHN